MTAKVSFYNLYTSLLQVTAKVNKITKIFMAIFNKYGLDLLATG